MVSLSGILLTVAFLIVIQLLVVSATERARALMPWRVVLMLLALMWWTTPMLKKAYVDDVFYPNDSVLHEDTAREIAYLMRNGDFDSARDYFGFGNEGYRFVLGSFYALTNAPEVVTYGIHGLLGFWGMLSVLEMAVVQTRARKVPFWVLLITLANPSALFWTTFNLKEGAMLWGLCLSLRLTMRFGDVRKQESLFWPVLGILTAGFLRPHIMAAYLAAMGVGVAIRQRRIGMAVATTCGMLVAFSLLKIMAPVIFENIAVDGLSTTMTEKFHELNAGEGSAITYRYGAPIPLISGFILINLRPFPWEVSDITTIAAGGEVWIISGLSVLCWYLLSRRSRLLQTSYVITLVFAILALSFYFSYMYNMGLMVRQRVMAYPALISMAILPGLAIINRTTLITQQQVPSQIPTPVMNRHQPARRPVRPIRNRGVRPHNKPIVPVRRRTP